MSMFQEYIQYLKDNPEGYWFKRKLYGWGWTPARKQGWAVTAVFIATVLGLLIGAETRMVQFFNDSELLLIVALATVLFMGIVWKTGEPPRWQWGNKKKK